MIKNYLQQLKHLQEDKLNFQNQTCRNQLTKTLSRQEDKYQAYIIEQMASQNRIIAASNIADTLNKLLRRNDSKLFNQMKKRQYEEQSSTSIRRKACDQSVQYDGDSVSVDFMLVRLYASMICRYASKAYRQVQKQAFSKVVEFSKKKQIMEKLTKNTNKYYLRRGIQAMKAVERRPIQSEEGLFNDSFSVIHRQEKIKSKHCEESYLSFILDKQNNNGDCHSCKDSCQMIIQKDIEIKKLKEEASYLKHLLTEKTLELKKKQEEIDAGILRQSESSDQSDYISQNSSYYSQLERQVFGGKRIRKNGSRHPSTTQLPKEQISKELLSKYMRQSFQCKESMDVARELCLDLQQRLPLVYNGHIQSILKVLNLGEEVSLVDQYA